MVPVRLSVCFGSSRGKMLKKPLLLEGERLLYIQVVLFSSSSHLKQIQHLRNDVYWA